MSRKKIDILHGPLESTLLFLSLPVLAGLLAQVVYNVTDTLFLAWIDKGNTSIIAGVGLVFPIFFIMIAFSQGLANGVSTVVAISIGAGDNHEAEKAGATGIAMACGVSVVVIGLCALWGDDLLKVLAGSQISPEALLHGKEYLYWLLPGFFLLFFAQTMFGVLQGEGLTKYQGPAMILTVIVNLILDPIFIFVLNMDVVGASIATSLAYLVMTIFALVVFVRKGSSLHILPRAGFLSWKMVRQITSLGLPMSLGLIVMSFSFVVLNWLIGNVSEAALNAFSLAGRFDYMLLTPMFAFSTGMAVIIGQSYGAGDLLRVRHAFSHGAMLTIGASTLVAIVYILAAPYIFPAFSNDSHVVSLAIWQTRWLAIPTALGAGLGIISGFAFQSLAQPIKSFFAIVIRALLITVPMAFFFFYVWGVHAESVWAAMGLGNVLGGTICFVWCQRNMKKLTMEKVEEIIAS